MRLGTNGPGDGWTWSRSSASPAGWPSTSPHAPWFGSVRGRNRSSITASCTTPAARLSAHTSTPSRRHILTRRRRSRCMPRRPCCRSRSRLRCGLLSPVLPAAGSYFALARVLGLHTRPGMLLCTALAHLVVAYYFQWDMRSINCNLLVLAALLFGCSALAARPRHGDRVLARAQRGAKVLPILVLPYLAWTRRWRAFAWAGVFSLVFWVGVPLAAFGSDGFPGRVRRVGGRTDPRTPTQT